jgi:para-nitrobenzyl esterase
MGKLRWAAKQPATDWPVVRNADIPACPQNHVGPDATAFFGDKKPKAGLSVPERLDPAKTAADMPAVRVWIHDGGFRVGSVTERLHHGEHLAARSVVPVTFNWASSDSWAHPELTKESRQNATGHYGLIDRVRRPNG